MEDIDKILLLDRLDNLINEFENNLVNQEFGDVLFSKDLKEVGSLMEDLKLNILKTAFEKKRITKDTKIIKVDKERKIMKKGDKDAN